MISPQTSSGPCGQPWCRPQKPSNKSSEQGRHSSLPATVLLQPGSTQGDVSQSKLSVLGFAQNTSQAGQTDAGKASERERRKTHKPCCSIQVTSPASSLRLGRGEEDFSWVVQFPAHISSRADKDDSVPPLPPLQERGGTDQMLLTPQGRQGAPGTGGSPVQGAAAAWTKKLLCAFSSSLG